MTATEYNREKDICSGMKNFDLIISFLFISQITEICSIINKNTENQHEQR